MQDSDSATSSEMGDVTEVDDYDFLEFLGDWSESIVFEGVADAIDYGENPNSRFKDDSAVFKKRRLEVMNSTIRQSSSAELPRIPTIGAAVEPPSYSKKSMKFGTQHGSGVPQDILLKNPEFQKLEILPESLYRAFNEGNLTLVSDIICASFAPDCALQTMIMDTPLIGRQHTYRFFEAFTVSHPDIVVITKNAKVCLDAEGRCIKYKFYWTGTNVFPIEAKEYYYERGGNLMTHLDVSKLSKKELTAMKILAAKVKTTGSSYASVGRGVGRMALNDRKEISEFRMTWRLLSIRDPKNEIEAALAIN